MNDRLAGDYPSTGQPVQARVWGGERPPSSLAGMGDGAAAGDGRPAGAHNVGHGVTVCSSSSAPWCLSRRRENSRLHTSSSMCAHGRSTFTWTKVWGQPRRLPLDGRTGSTWSVREMEHYSAFKRRIGQPHTAASTHRAPATSESATPLYGTCGPGRSPGTERRSVAARGRGGRKEASVRRHEHILILVVVQV